MVKPYLERGVTKPVMVTDSNVENDSNQEHETWGDTPDLDVECKIRLSNSEIVDDSETKLSHAPTNKRVSLIELLLKYKSVFPGSPNRTNVLVHDVNVGNTRPIKQHLYRVSPIKLQKLRQEVQYMLDKDIIKPIQSRWASPRILVCTSY